jgi:hypothetical protein
MKLLVHNVPSFLYGWAQMSYKPTTALEWEKGGGEHVSG